MVTIICIDIDMYYENILRDFDFGFNDKMP